MTRTVVLDSDSGIGFWWKVSSEENNDILSFYINDELKESISGEVDWTEVSYDLPAGTYNLVWEYKKNSTVSSGSDAAWVDDISIHGYAMTVENTIATYEANDLLDGEYIYSVEAYDLSDNDTVSTKRSFDIDTVAPTGSMWVSPYYHNKETSGDKVYIDVTLRDGGSYVKNVCLWLGDKENLLQSDFDNCQDLSEKNYNSHIYAPEFNFRNWDSSKVADGPYNIYAIATDNAGNESRISFFVKLNNHSEGSIENPSEISTCSEFQAINNNLNWNYKLINDIDCSETKNWNWNRGFVGIGDSSKSFSGVLDGQNYHVYDLYQNQSSTNSGIFYSMGGTVKNLNLRNVDIKCNSSYCGAFTHYNTGTIEKSSITGSLQCSGKCGGFASQQSGTVSESWGDMTIGSGGYTGGIAGQNYNGIIKNTYFKGSVEGSTSGGVVGLNEGGWSGGTVQNSYSNAHIEGGDWNYNGGLIGWQYTGGKQTASYWNKEVSGLDNMCGKNGTNCLDENGLTDTEMKDAESFVDWDFENIWAIDPDKNDGYPYLRWQTSFSETDTTAPVITLLGSGNVELFVGDAYTDQGASALDDVDGDISSEIIIDNNVNTSVVGTYYVKYNVSDSSGNEAIEVVRTVRVVEKPAPSSSGGGTPLSFLIREDVKTEFQTYDPLKDELTIYDDEDVVVLGIEEEFIQKSEAEAVFESISNKKYLLEMILGEENTEGEANVSAKYSKLFKAEDNDKHKKITNFIFYGTETTIKLGEGERAGVVNSYKSAFGKLPETVSDWEDIIKIANGRWPGEINEEAEEKAMEKFRQIYLRDADRENAHDDAALVVIAYGLRPSDRNMQSEKNAIGFFRGIFGYAPDSATDWDIVRAIAYSGAKR